MALKIAGGPFVAFPEILIVPDENPLSCLTRLWHSSCYSGGMSQQSILFCILPGNRTAGQRLEQLARKVRTSASVHVVRQLDDVRATLLYPSEKIGVAVLFAATRQELLDLKSIWSLLEDMRTILILPDGEEETVAVAHTMRPRFITCGDRDFRDVVAVLEKMTGISIGNGSMQT
jgi:hypothetical protein